MKITYPIRDIDLVLRACNPAEPLPAGDSRWFDFGPLRHQQTLERLLRIFKVPPERDFHHRLLCGHRGSGKSTELLRFKEQAEAAGFAVERIEVDVRYGYVNLEIVDLFLLAAQAAEGAVERRGGVLAPELIREVIQWFADVTTEQTRNQSSEIQLEAKAQLGGNLPLGLGKLIGKFASSIKAGANHAKTVRLQLRSLDRYPPKNVDEIVVRGSTLLHRLGCHALFVVPVDLEYKPLSSPLRDAYGRRCFARALFRRLHSRLDAPCRTFLRNEHWRPPDAPRRPACDQRASRRVSPRARRRRPEAPGVDRSSSSNPAGRGHLSAALSPLGSRILRSRRADLDRCPPSRHRNRGDSTCHRSHRKLTPRRPTPRYPSSASRRTSKNRGVACVDSCGELEACSA